MFAAGNQFTHPSFATTSFVADPVPELVPVIFIILVFVKVNPVKSVSVIGVDRVRLSTLIDVLVLAVVEPVRIISTVALKLPVVEIVAAATVPIFVPAKYRFIVLEAVALPMMLPVTVNVSFSPVADNVLAFVV